MICIICRENKKNMSKEHVIPDSLGGAYCIYSVCKDCNSMMGEKIDGPLVNHKLAQLYRLKNKMKGKSGSIPNPFSDIVIDDEISNIKTVVRVDQSTGDIYTKYLPRPKYFPPNEDGIARLEVSVDVDNKRDTIDSIVEKFLYRNKIPRSAATIRKSKIEEITGVIEFEYELDSSKFLIGLLKIAYEFSTDVVPAYFLDEDAIKISKILSNADYESAEQYFKLNQSLSFASFSNIYQDLNIDKEDHSLLLLENPLGLFCLVKLGDLFRSIVTLSKNSNFFNNNEGGWIGVNDLESRKFKKMNLRDYARDLLRSKPS